MSFHVAIVMWMFRSNAWKRALVLEVGILAKKDPIVENLLSRMPKTQNSPLLSILNV